MKKLATMAISVGLIGAMVAGGSLAYLSSTDSDVNVMTLGNVKVKQNEQQRVEKDGEFTSTLEDFKQGKILMPVTYPGGRTADTVTIGEYEIELGDDEANYVDKIISVTNTGSADAYVRTLVAVPTGGAAWESTPVAASDCWLHWNILKDYASHWTLVSNDVPLIQIDGEGYYVWEFIHNDPVKSGETTYPAVRGFYMDKRVNNDNSGFFMTYENGTTKRIEDISADDTVNIIAITQAVQAAGFDNAQTALNEAFGAPEAINAETENMNVVDWFSGLTVPTLVDNANEVYQSTLENGNFTLTSDIKTSDAEKHYSGNREYAITGARNYILNLNGHTINHDGSSTGYTYLYTTAYNGKLTINGEGTINSANADGSACIVYAQGPSEVVINGGAFNVDKGIAVWAGKNGKITINGGSFISTGSSNEELIYSSGGIIDIYGGFFHNTGQENRPVNVANANRSTGFINIYGGTFVNFDPSTGGDDPNNIRVMEGYKVVSETQANGDIWYTVVAE